MKAKDTVMSDEQICAELVENKNTIDLSRDMHPAEQTIAIARNFCKAQAEISFKAGIKEVVGWIEEKYRQQITGDPEWQTQLKEWGDL